MEPGDDRAHPPAIDRPILERMQSRFAGSRLVDSAAIVDEPRVHLCVTLSGDYYPSAVSARLEIRWDRNDDFSLQYQETRQDETWGCRWNRHPNTHNSREHFHPPPTADHIGVQDAVWSNDHREMCQRVLGYVKERIEALWRQK